eukprot:12364710-Karenia_brevis.AAC.1
MCGQLLPQQRRLQLCVTDCRAPVPDERGRPLTAGPLFRGRRPAGSTPAHVRQGNAHASHSRAGLPQRHPCWRKLARGPRSW